MTRKRSNLTFAIASLAGVIALGNATSAGAQELTVVSFGGAYQDAQSKALFQPAAKALGIKLKEETYTSISAVAVKVKAGAMTWDVVASGSGSAARAGAEGYLEKLDYGVIDKSSFIPQHRSRLLRRRRCVFDRPGLEHKDLWCQWPEILGRLLGCQEIPGQAVLPERLSLERSSLH